MSRYFVATKTNSLSPLICVFFLFVLFLSGPSMIGAQTSKTPTLTDEQIWSIINKNVKKKLFVDSPTVTLLHKDVVTFKENGASIKNSQFLIAIQADEGARKYRTLRFDYNIKTSYVAIKEIKIYNSEKNSIRMVPHEGIEAVPAPDDGLIFWNFSMKVVPLGILESGDVLYYEIERRGMNIAYLSADGDAAHREFLPPMPGHYFEVVYFESDQPIIDRQYHLYGPRSKLIQYEIENGTIDSSILFEDQMLHYCFQKRDIPAYVSEYSSISFDQAALKVVLATNPDWEGKSRWAYELNEPQFVISAEMQQKVDELLTGTTTDDEKMAILLHWVADNIRYLGLDMGEGEGFTVHRTDEIFAERAGVCKDKAACLISMLRAAGIPAYFVLTLALEKAVDIPADQFNHGVVAVPREDGTFIYLDPTWAPQDRALFNKREQEQSILIASPEGEDLGNIPYSPAEENYWHISGKSSLEISGDVHLTMDVEADNFAGGKMRQSLAARSPLNKPLYFHKIVNPLSAEAIIEKSSFQNPLDYSSPLNLSLTIFLPDYAIVLDDRILLVPPLSRHPFSRAWESDYLYVVDPDERTKPLELDCTRKMHFTETMKIPRGYTLTERDEIRMSSETATLTYVIEQKGRNLNVLLDFSIHRRIVSPEEYPQFRKMVQQIKELRDRHIVLMKRSKGEL